MRAFTLIVIAGLGCAALGSGFGWLVGSLSPEFITLIVQPYPVAEPQRLCAALGLVSGLLLGVVAMAFGLLLEALRPSAHSEKISKELHTNQTLHESDHIKDRSSRIRVPPI